MAQVHASIHDLRTAITLSSCEQLHADVTGYCRALLECEVLDEVQYQALRDQADAALSERRLDPYTLDALPSWPSSTL